MTINFGNRPWRYKPVEDYIGFSSAPEKYVSDNNKNGAVVQERKIVANAPQAIIIEVMIILNVFNVFGVY